MDSWTFGHRPGLVSQGQLSFFTQVVRQLTFSSLSWLLPLTTRIPPRRTTRTALLRCGTCIFWNDRNSCSTPRCVSYIPRRSLLMLV